MASIFDILSYTPRDSTRAFFCSTRSLGTGLDRLVEFQDFIGEGYCALANAEQLIHRLHKFLVIRVALSSQSPLLAPQQRSDSWLEQMRSLVADSCNL